MEQVKILFKNSFTKVLFLYAAINATVAMAIDSTSKQKLESAKNVAENSSSIKNFLLFISQLAGTVALVVFALWLILAIFAKVFFQRETKHG